MIESPLSVLKAMHSDLEHLTASMGRHIVDAHLDRYRSQLRAAVVALEAEADDPRRLPLDPAFAEAIVLRDADGSFLLAGHSGTPRVWSNKNPLHARTWPTDGEARAWLAEQGAVYADALHRLGFRFVRLEVACRELAEDPAPPLTAAQAAGVVS